MKSILGITVLFALLIGMGIVVGMGWQGRSGEHDCSIRIYGSKFKEAQAVGKKIRAEARVHAYRKEKAFILYGLGFENGNPPLQTRIQGYQMANKRPTGASLGLTEGKWDGIRQGNAIAGVKGP